MKITKLEIKNFGKFKDFTISLEDGLNIIYGLNEAGKSTIQWFIKGMLFGLRGGRISKEGLLPPLKRYRPWKGQDYGGSIFYKLDYGESYRVERNFNTGTCRIYDILFNDITNTFVIERDNGPLFAERHLGLDEACFNRTAIIGQMESRIDENGRKVLLSKLANLSQTGYEDISFARAQEALKEAIKLQVGTDKTSTRPMDVVTSRLTELKSLLIDLEAGKDTLHEVERELACGAEAQTGLEREKLKVNQSIELIRLKSAFEKKKKLKESLSEIYRQVLNNETEYAATVENREKYESLNEEYIKFSIYSEEDIEEMESGFGMTGMLREEIKRLESDISTREEEIRILKPGIAVISAFEGGRTPENEVSEICREMDALKAEIEKYDISLVNEKINNFNNKNKSVLLSSVLLLILSTVSVAAGFFEGFIGYLAGSLFFLLFLIIQVLRSRGKNRMYSLLEEKRVSILSLNKLTSDYNKSKNRLEYILSSAGVDNLNDFYKVIAEYGSKTLRVNLLEKEVMYIRNMMDTKKEKLDILKIKINKILMNTDIISNIEQDTKEEGIRRFKSKVRECAGYTSGLKSEEDRINNISVLKRNQLSSFTVLSGIECGSAEQAAEIIAGYEKDLRNISEELDGKYISNFGGEEILTVSDICNESELMRLENKFEERYIELDQRYKELTIKMFENDAIMRNFNDDDEVQKISEEIAELENRKSKLEEMDYSLKMALNILTEACNEIQRDFIPMLNSKLGEIINDISGGKYVDLRADKGLNLLAIAPETGEIVPAFTLSGGTIDQMYMALRISAAEVLLNSKEKLLFIMDEIFSQYDDNRTQNAFEYLSSIAEERQIILFTCKGREVEIAKNLNEKNINIIEI